MILTKSAYEVFQGLFQQFTGEVLKDKGYTVKSFEVVFDEKSENHLISLTVQKTDNILPPPKNFSCAIEEEAKNVIYFKAVKNNDKAYARILKSLAELDKWSRS